MSTIVNADSATVKGFELEIVAHPTDSLTINAGIGLLDTAYGELVLAGPNNTIISGKGNESGRAIDTATNTGQYL